MEKKYMKSQFIFITCLLATFFLLPSCSGPGKNDVADSKNTILDDDYYEFQGLSLKKYDIPVMIMLPDETADIGASTEPEVLHIEDDFKWEVLVGSNFHLLIDDWGDYTDMVISKKKELKQLDFYKIKYLIDEKDFILYEQELMPKGSTEAATSVGIPHKSYHVYAQKVIDGVTYVFRSRDEGFEKPIIELMAKSIKSVKALKK
jgi:hypothetical protein